MKVIFLDIDGVLNTYETFMEKNKCSDGKNIEIDEFRIKYLKEIIDKTNAKIVLFSGWSNYFIKKNNQIVPVHPKGYDLFWILKKYEIFLEDVIYLKNINKVDLINNYLNSHLEILSFVIIDDCPYGYKNSFSSNLIKTSVVNYGEMLKDIRSSFGLCDYHINSIIDILNNKNNIKARTKTKPINKI